MHAWRGAARGDNSPREGGVHPADVEPPGRLRLPAASGAGLAIPTPIERAAIILTLGVSWADYRRVIEVVNHGAIVAPQLGKGCGGTSKDVGGEREVICDR